jgi:hypothetical protein
VAGQKDGRKRKVEVEWSRRATWQDRKWPVRRLTMMMKWQSRDVGLASRMLFR